jgi:hypothetical protein
VDLFTGPDAAPPAGCADGFDLDAAPEPDPLEGLVDPDPDAVPVRSGEEPDGRVDPALPPEVLPRL